MNVNPNRVSPSEGNPRKRSLSEMASTQSEGRPPPPVQPQEATRDQELAWELLRVVVRLNEDSERERKRGEETMQGHNGNQVDNHHNYNSNNHHSFQANGNTEAVIERGQVPTDEPQQPLSRLWSQQPLINCLAVLLVVQRLEQVQRELNQQTSQFMHMAQLLSDLLGPQFRVPIPAQTQSAMDWILPVCQRNPPALLGTLVAGLLYTSQRQQEQQRMMESLQQQIVRLQENGTSPLSSQQLFEIHAVQQQHQQQQSQSALPLFQEQRQQVQQQHQSQPAQEQQGGQNLSSALQRAIQHLFEQQQQCQQVPGQPLMVQQQQQHPPFQWQQQQQQQESSGPDPLLCALLQLNESRQAATAGQGTTFMEANFSHKGQPEDGQAGNNYYNANNGNAMDADESDLDNSDNDDISLAEDTDTASNPNPSVPQYVNVPSPLPSRKAVVAAQGLVHVVPSSESARAVANDPTQAIMPPPRQDMEMVSSLSDAEFSSASSTASSLTMGSVVSRLTT